MSKMTIQYKDADFDQAGDLVYPTVAELDYPDLLDGIDVDDSAETITINDIDDNQASEIFSTLVSGMISEFPSFEMICDYGKKIHFEAKYKENKLTVEKRVNGSSEREVFQLEDGLFDDDDGDTFAMFFDL